MQRRYTKLTPLRERLQNLLYFKYHDGLGQSPRPLLKFQVILLKIYSI